MLSATNVGKDFGSVRAIDEVTLGVEPGEAVCLLGANGAGKTTMMNLFLGFLRPDRGQVRVAGKDPYAQPAQARGAIAYIPENVALYETMTGLENLAFFDRLAGHRRRERELLDYLDAAGLSAEQARRPVRGYSKGMRQKVGLAVAAAKDARVLLLDEPMSGLDPSAARDFTTRLNEFKQEGRAVLMATHDIFRAKECATRLGIMRTGRLMDVVDSERMDAVEIEKVYLEHMGREAAA